MMKAGCSCEDKWSQNSAKPNHYRKLKKISQIQEEVERQRIIENRNKALGLETKIKPISLYEYVPFSPKQKNRWREVNEELPRRYQKEPENLEEEMERHEMVHKLLVSGGKSLAELKKESDLMDASDTDLTYQEFTDRERQRRGGNAGSTTAENPARDQDSKHSSSSPKVRQKAHTQQIDRQSPVSDDNSHRTKQCFSKKPSSNSTTESSVEKSYQKGNTEATMAVHQQEQQRKPFYGRTPVSLSDPGHKSGDSLLEEQSLGSQGEKSNISVKSLRDSFMCRLRLTASDGGLTTKRAIKPPNRLGAEFQKNPNRRSLPDNILLNHQRPKAISKYLYNGPPIN